MFEVKHDTSVNEEKSEMETGEECELTEKMGFIGTTNIVFFVDSVPPFSFNLS